MAEANREPTLWDTHEQVEMNKNTAKHLLEEIKLIHQMLDKDVWADQRCVDQIPKECSTTKLTNNIRFETSQAAQETKAVLEECQSELIRLKYKIHTQEPNPNCTSNLSITGGSSGNVITSNRF